METVTMLPRVADVLDRLTATASPKALALSDQLTDAVTEVCRTQGLASDPAAIEAAVQAHLTEGTLPAPVATETDWGWRRPTSEAERVRRQTVGRFRRFLVAWGRELEDKNEFLITTLTLTSLLLTFFSGIVVGRIFSSSFWSFFGYAGATIGTFVTSVLLLIAVPVLTLEKQQYLNKQVPDEKTLQHWLAYPQTRAAVRRCLDSALPYLMRGDVDHINKLAKTAEAAALAARIQAEEHARMQDLRSQLQAAVPGNT